MRLIFTDSTLKKASSLVRNHTIFPWAVILIYPPDSNEHEKHHVGGS